MTLETEQRPRPETDDKYFHAAMRELMGPDFVLEPNVPVDAAILSRIAQRAAEMKLALNPAQLMALVRDREPVDLFRFLADHVYTAHLADGRRIHDAIDFKQWLVELAEEAKR